jgi:hypothetical protein
MQNKTIQQLKRLFFSNDGLTFGDIIDVINPLQHIPVVSTIYWELTGDKISPAARMAGGALFGGPIKGFGNSVRTRFQPVTHRTPSTLPTRSTPQISHATPATSSAMPQISARLSNQLTLLAA